MSFFNALSNTNKIHLHWNSDSTRLNDRFLKTLSNKSICTSRYRLTVAALILETSACTVSQNKCVQIKNYEVSHRTHSSDSCMYGPLPVPCLCGLLSEEEIHFIIVSVVVVWDEMGSDELRVCRGRCKKEERWTLV